MIKEFKNNFMQSKYIFQIGLLFLAIALSYVVLNNLSFLISPTLWGITFFLTFRPLYRRLAEKEKWNKYLASGFIVFILIISLLILLTLTYLVINAKLLPLFQHPEIIRDYFNSFIFNLNNAFHNSALNSLSSNLSDNVLKFIPKIADYLIPFLKNLGTITLDILFSLIIFYILTINDKEIRKFSIQILPFKEDHSVAILNKFENLVRGNALVIPLVALSQGILGFIGYWLFGMSFVNAVILGFLTAIASIIPVIGTAVVYIPVALYVGLVHNSLLFGLLILIWGVVIIGSGDNVVRAFFQKKISNISFWYTVLGSVLGIQIFGLSGLIFGPILLILVVSLWKIYYKHYGIYKSE